MRGEQTGHPHPPLGAAKPTYNVSDPRLFEYSYGLAPN